MGIQRRKTAFPEDRIYLGKITKPHALSGEVKFKSFGCDPEILAEVGPIRLEKTNRLLEVEYVRGSSAVPVVKFKTIDDRTAAEQIIGSVLWVEETQLPPLEADCYYESDFLFCRVVTVSGKNLGRVEDIIPTGECDVFVIRNAEGNEFLLPAAAQIVKEFRKAEKLLIVEPPMEWSDSE